MSSWSQRRRFIYAAIVVVVLVCVVGLPTFFHFYKAPTCFDNSQNHGEQGIDCGGPCERLCPSSFLGADATWTRFEEVSPGLYNVGTYIINPNTNGGALNAPYHVVLYDNAGVEITDVKGTVTIPPHRNTVAFLPAVPVDKRLPAKALFEFTSTPNWVKKLDSLSALNITDKKYSEDKNGSNLAVTIENNSVQSMPSLAIYAVLYDRDGNTLDFSKTYVDEIAPHASAVAPFTWPTSHHGAVISIEVLPVAE